MKEKINSKIKKAGAVLVISVLIASVVSLCGCTEEVKEESQSGVPMTSATVDVGSDGMTNEQRNIKKRTELENSEGNIQYFYAVVVTTGQILFQSTVDGKVTSSGKRLTPTTIEVGEMLPDHGVRIGDNVYETREIIQDDGTYGTSSEYLFWFDMNGNYFQFFLTQGIMPITSDRPLTFETVIYNLDTLGQNSTGWS